MAKFAQVGHSPLPVPQVPPVSSNKKVSIPCRRIPQNCVCGATGRNVVTLGLFLATLDRKSHHSLAQGLCRVTFLRLGPVKALIPAKQTRLSRSFCELVEKLGIFRTAALPSPPFSNISVVPLSCCLVSAAAVQSCQFPPPLATAMHDGHPRLHPRGLKGEVKREDPRIERSFGS